MAGSAHPSIWGVFVKWRGRNESAGKILTFISQKSYGVLYRRIRPSSAGRIVALTRHFDYNPLYRSFLPCPMQSGSYPRRAASNGRLWPWLGELRPTTVSSHLQRFCRPGIGCRYRLWEAGRRRLAMPRVPLPKKFADDSPRGRGMPRERGSVGSGSRRTLSHMPGAVWSVGLRRRQSRRLVP